MKSTIPFLILLLLATSALAASWGSVDFRILESKDSRVFPLVIEFDNYRGKELQADLIIETLSPEAEFGPSEITKKIIIKKDPELLFIDFPVTKKERYYDVWISVYVDDELAEQMYNSLIRIQPEALEERQELPLLPGEQMNELLEESKIYLEEIYLQYPHLDQLPINQQIEIVMRAQAEAYNLTEEEYLKRIGADAKSIAELTNPGDEQIAKALANLEGNEKKKDYRAIIIISLSLIAAISLVGGGVYLLNFSRRYKK